MKYRTIVADPPWPYRQKLGRGKSQGHLTRGGLPYRAMSLDEIERLPISELAEDDSMLWLWTTNSHLPNAVVIMERQWGFRYITMATWGKVGREGRPQIGLGYWLRGATEHVLLGVRGNPRSRMVGPNGATGRAWSTLLLAPRSEHSEKPQVFYDMVEDISEPPMLELFARRRRLGWDVWGNEVDPTVEVFPSPARGQAGVEPAAQEQSGLGSAALASGDIDSDGFHEGTEDAQ